jgi:glycosyltransferase involved in cell wall biosynthesis
MHHAGEIGGSSMSLLYLARDLNRKLYEPTIVLIRPSEKLQRLYGDAGIAVVNAKGISTFEHTTAKSYSVLKPWLWFQIIYQMYLGLRSIYATRNIVRQLNPDIVHLNSVVLLWSAFSLRNAAFPVVWHVREHPVKGLFGLRKNFIRYALSHWPTCGIFLTETAKREWIGNRTGDVVTNFVNFAEFDYRTPSEGFVKQHALEGKFPIILYVGGIMEIKGVLTLLQALSIVQKRFDSVCCLMPGSIVPAKAKRNVKFFMKKGLSVLGIKFISQKFFESVEKYRLNDVCLCLPFQTDMAVAYSACDIVAFPAVEPHFSRPILEAGAMKKPVVASNLPGIEEQLKNGGNGILVSPRNPQELAQAIVSLAENADMMTNMGEAGYVLAKTNHASPKIIAQVETLYARLLASRNIESSM